MKVITRTSCPLSFATDAARYTSGLRRALLAALTVGIASALSISLASCSLAPKSDKEVLREGTAAMLDPLKNLDEATIAGMMTDFMAKADLGRIGVDGVTFSKAAFAAFDYHIEDVVITDKDAKVETTIMTRDLVAALDDYQKQVEELKRSPQASGMSIDALNKQAGIILMECIEKAPLRVTTVDLPWHLEGTVWKPTDAFNIALGAAFADKPPAS